MPVEKTEPDDVDPQHFVPAMPHISPEDAAKVRERTPGTRRSGGDVKSPSPDGEHEHE